MIAVLVQKPERACDQIAPDDPSRSRQPADYGRPMTASVHDVAAAIYRRLPGLPPDNLHKLLYYCQGHSLALAGQPMFSNKVIAAHDGPRIEGFTEPEPEPKRIERVYANTVLYVVGRYGNLTLQDLTRLTQGETPWQATAAGEEITHEALRAFFTTAGAPAGMEDPRHKDPAIRRQLREHLEQSRAAEAARHAG